MPFFNETIKQGAEYDINVDARTSPKVAITLLKINRRDRLAAAEQRSVPAGALFTLTDTAAANIDRVIISVHPVGGATVTVEVRQPSSGVSFAQTCNGDTDLVFETVP